MVAAWDIVAKDYYLNCLSTAGLRKKPELSTPFTQGAPYHRLYQDFLDRRDRRLAFEAEQERVRQQMIAQESTPKYIDRNPTLNAESQRKRLDQLSAEHEKLRQYFATLQELEQERQYLAGVVNVRQVHTKVPVDEQDPLLEELKFLGCPTANAEAINCLFANHKRAVISHVISKCKASRDNQKHMIAGEEEIKLFEARKLETEVKTLAREAVQSVLHVVMAAEGLTDTNLMVRRGTEPDAKFEWCYRPTLAQLIKTSVMDYLLKQSCKFEELVAKRREILFDTMQMSLQNLIAATQLDVSLRSLFVTLRLPKLQIRGYRYDLPEEIRANEWFKNHVGSTTSLKNNFTINHSVREIILEQYADLYEVPAHLQQPFPAPIPAAQSFNAVWPPLAPEESEMDAAHARARANARAQQQLQFAPLPQYTAPIRRGFGPRRDF